MATRIIRKFGGPTPTARALNKRLSTVQRWESSGSIPMAYWEEILAVAKERNAQITPEDFVSHIPGFENIICLPKKMRAVSDPIELPPGVQAYGTCIILPLRLDT